MLQRLQNTAEVHELKPCISLEEVRELQQVSSRVKVEPSLQQYILNLVRATREDEEGLS